MASQITVKLTLTFLKISLNPNSLSTSSRSLQRSWKIPPTTHQKERKIEKHWRKLDTSPNFFFFLIPILGKGRLRYSFSYSIEHTMQSGGPPWLSGYFFKSSSISTYIFCRKKHKQNIKLVNPILQVIKYNKNKK